MNIQKSPFVYCGENMGHRDFSAIHVHFDHQIDVHVMEDHELVSPIPVGMNMFICINGFPDAVDDKGCEGGFLVNPRFKILEYVAGFCNIYFD